MALICWDPFTVKDFLGMLISIEVKGESFYARMAEKAGDEKLKELLLFLAEEEKNHIKDIRRLAAGLAGDEEAGGKFCDEDRVFIYSLIAESPFHQMEPEEALQKIGSAREALEMALRFERDVILIFKELRDFVEPVHKALMQQLIDQEKEHFNRLAHSYDRV